MNTRPTAGCAGSPPVDASLVTRERDRPGPWRSWLVAGAVLILLGLILGVIVRGSRVFPGELSFLQWMHQRPNDLLDRVAWWASRMGDSYTGLLGATVLVSLWCAWRGRQDLAFFLIVASALRILGPPIKWLFDSARPPLDLRAVIEPVNGLGYPSGHTLGAVLVFGAALLAVPQTLHSPIVRWIARLLCLAFMVLIPWSRMRLGVHWPSDIAGGYLFGFGIVALVWGLLPRVLGIMGSFRARQRRWRQSCGHPG